MQNSLEVIRSTKTRIILLGVLGILISTASTNAVNSGAATGGNTDQAALIQRIDASVHRRDTGLSGYTVNEHYAVFNSKDEEHPAAEMSVKTTYTRESGKTYAILNETGTKLMQKLLEVILDNEKRLTQPANRVTSLISSENYEMVFKGREILDGRDCKVVAIKPRRSSPYLFEGTIWVDAQDASIAQLEGTSVKSASVLAGVSHVSRQYSMIDGFPMATHAKASSSTFVLGQVTVKIDYSGYEIRASGSR